MFKLIILHKNNTDMICQNDGEEAKSISLTKRYIFIEVNLNVFIVVHLRNQLSIHFLFL